MPLFFDWKSWFKWKPCSPKGCGCGPGEKKEEEKKGKSNKDGFVVVEWTEEK